MFAPSVLLDLFAVGTMAFGAIAIALLLGAAWARDEKSPPLLDHTARNVLEALAALGVSAMIAVLDLLLLPFLVVMGPFLVLAAWTLLEPPRYVRYA